MATTKKDRPPLVVHQESVPFYKAFIFPTGEADMVIDTSGEQFFHTIEDAIAGMVDSVDDSKFFNEMPSRFFQFDDGEEIDTTNTTVNPHLADVIVLRMLCHWDQEYDNAKSDDDGKSFIMRLKDVTNGYTTALQEYRIDEITLVTAKKDAVPKFHLKSFEAHVPDATRMNHLYPEKIIIK